MTRGVRSNIDFVLNAAQGTTLLHTAAATGSLTQLLHGLSLGVDCNAQDIRGCTPLFSAANEGHGAIMRALLSAGADHSIRNVAGRTPLHVAVLTTRLEMVQILLEAGAFPDPLANNCTPLLLATEKGKTEIVRELIRAGADPIRQCEMGKTPIWVAAFKGHLEIFLDLVRNCDNPALPTHANQPPLAACVQENHKEIVREFLRLGPAGYGGEHAISLAIRIAAKEQNLEILEMLSDAGGVDRGGLGLLDASLFGKKQSVRFLLSRSGNRTTDQSKLGATALHQAAEVGHPEVVSMLLAAGACEYVVDNMKCTPFERARLPCRIRMSAESLQSEGTDKKLACARLILRAPAFRARSWMFPRNKRVETARQQGKDYGGGGDVPAARTSQMNVIIVRRPSRLGRRLDCLLLTMIRYSNKQ